MDSLYGKVSPSVWQKAQKIKLFVCDIDGVFSDGRIYLGNNVGVITGRNSNIVQTRMTALNVKHIVQGEENKLPALKAMLASLKLKPEQVAYIGDDMPDFDCLNYVGFSIAVNDAHPAILNLCDYITYTRGGFGAVRETCDLIMQSQQTLANASGASI